MHEANQRRLVRTTFVLTCLVPTLGVVGWAIAWRLDFFADRLQLQLRQQLGAVIQSAKTSQPRPNLVRMEKVRLLDPETNQQLVFLDHVELTSTSDQYTFAANNATLDANQIRRLGQLMRTQLTRHSAPSRRHATFTCNTLEIVDDSARILLHQVEGSGQSLASSVRTALSFAMNDQSDAPRVELAMVRDRTSAVPQTWIDLNTGEVAVPVGIISRSAKHRLGPDAIFQGICRVEYRDDQWQATNISGSLEQVDSERWIVEPIPYRLTGRGSVVLHTLQLSRHGIEQVIGRLRIDEGTIDSELLRSLANARFVALDPTINLGNKDNQRFAFRDLAFDLEMNAKGLTINAPRAEVTLNPAPRPTIAQSADGKAILEAKPQVPVDHLVFAIVPRNIHNATLTATRFQRILPRPQPSIKMAR